MKKPHLLAVAAIILSIGSSQAQSVHVGSKPYCEEWVFQIRWGHQDEWWKIFQKYQIATLDREKKLGFVKSYNVEVPDLHASDPSRWDYRIIVTYPNYEASRHGDDIERQLFPDTATREREEQRRWDLTVNHWDLPIHEIDPHS